MCWTQPGRQGFPANGVAPSRVAWARTRHTFDHMPDYRDLTDLQLALLGVLWERREATIGEVHDALSVRTPVTRKTIATLLSRLEKRGVVRRTARGNENIYSVAVTRRVVLVSRMMAMLGAVFEAPSTSAAPNLVGRGDVRAGDVARLRALLRKVERDIRGDR